MNRKYLIATLLGVFAIISWNVFLVYRDNAMFKVYYRHEAVKNLAHPHGK